MLHFPLREETFEVKILYILGYEVFLDPHHVDYILYMLFSFLLFLALQYCIALFQHTLEERQLIFKSNILQLVQYSLMLR